MCTVQCLYRCYGVGAAAAVPGDPLIRCLAVRWQHQSGYTIEFGSDMCTAQYLYCCYGVGATEAAADLLIQC